MISWRCVPVFSFRTVSLEVGATAVEALHCLLAFVPVSFLVAGPLLTSRRVKSPRRLCVPRALLRPGLLLDFLSLQRRHQPFSCLVTLRNAFPRRLEHVVLVGQGGDDLRDERQVVHWHLHFL